MGDKKQLATYGGQGDYQGGWITSFLQGKTIEALMMDGTFLIIRTTCGHEARIGWQDAKGNQLKASPFLENLDVKIQLVGAGFSGEAGGVG